MIHDHQRSDVVDFTREAGASACSLAPRGSTVHRPVPARPDEQLLPRRSSGRCLEEISMKAVVQDRYGSADVLEFGEVPSPTVGDGEVLVSVVAAGVDRG